MNLIRPFLEECSPDDSNEQGTMLITATELSIQKERVNSIFSRLISTLI